MRLAFPSLALLLLLPFTALAADGEVRHMSDLAQLQNVIATATTPVVVKFGATWCGPCRAFAPWFAEAAGIAGDRAIHVDFDVVTFGTPAARAYDVRSIPTLIVFHRGNQVQRPQFREFFGRELFQAWEAQYVLGL